MFDSNPDLAMAMTGSDNEYAVVVAVVVFPLKCLFEWQDLSTERNKQLIKNVCYCYGELIIVIIRLTKMHALYCGFVLFALAINAAEESALPPLERTLKESRPTSVVRHRGIGGRTRRDQKQSNGVRSGGRSNKYETALAVPSRNSTKSVSREPFEHSLKRISPDGMKSLSMWATGRTLRGGVVLPSHTDNSTSFLIIYFIFNTPDALSNLAFYLRALQWSFDVFRANGHISHRQYMHVFVCSHQSILTQVAEAGELSSMRWPSSHSSRVFALDDTVEGISSSCSNFPFLFKCISSKIKWRRYSTVAITGSSEKGPYLPVYWGATGYETWADAYASQLTTEVHIVGRSLSCPSHNEGTVHKATPGFDRGPVVFDRYVLRLISRRLFGKRPSEITYIMLMAGYNLLSMHGQPRGHDWRRWLTRPSLQCRPLTFEQRVCVVSDWRGRYPHLKHMALSEARPMFMQHNPPVGDHCHGICDYEYYKRTYGDLAEFSLSQAEEHFITFGSLEGRGCEVVEAGTYSGHVYESLFGGGEGGGLYEEAQDRIQSMDTSVLPVRTVNGQGQEHGRILVLFAYYEKNPQYRANLLYFLERTVMTDALTTDTQTDYVVIVNGPHTVSFPSLPNLHVIFRENTCLDFGAWGVALSQLRAEHAYVFFLNGSVRGPFLPLWLTVHWTVPFLAMLRGQVKLVGLSVNCPDGVGRGVPHVMSMAMAMCRDAVDLAVKGGVFDCAASYELGLRRESDLSALIMENGYNIASMQAAQIGVDFRHMYERSKNMSTGGVERVDGMLRYVFVDDYYTYKCMYCYIYYYMFYYKLDMECLHS